MSTVQDSNTGILRDKVFESGDTAGTPADALASSVRQDTIICQQKANDWQQAVDVLLGWKSSPDQFDPEDRPDAAILDTAIDYAFDQSRFEDGDVAPDSIIPSGSGRVAMEWNDGQETVIIDFVGRGVARYTLFKQGRVQAKLVLRRNPESRQLELQG
ncbi:MAG: hypothetical protein GC159_16345 [Phycisphaera sp.]|nr:hypothetical protein [Phycisphaera sp.]